MLCKLLLRPLQLAWQEGFGTYRWTGTSGSRSLSQWCCGESWVLAFPPGERRNYKKEERKTLRSTSTDQRRDRHCGQQLLVKWPRWGCSCLYLTDQKDYDQKGAMEKMLMESHQFAGKAGTSFRCRMLPCVQESRSPTPWRSSKWVPARRSTTSCLPFLLLAVLLPAPSGPCTPINIEQGKGSKGLKPFQQQLCWIKVWKMFLLRSV